MNVLVIGATGMLGRPVVRRLLEDGFRVRAMVRNLERGRSMLPPGAELVTGDIHDSSSLLDAMSGVDATYVNLAEPMRRTPPPLSPEVDGMRAVIDAARTKGVSRLVRISAMGVEDAAGQWWAAKHKLQADQLLMDSGADWTIFRPTWFMESLCTFRLPGRLLMCPDLPHSPLRWIAGDDYARQVSQALRSSSAINAVYEPQGPELLTIKTALGRFRNAWVRERLHILPIPIWTMRPAALAIGQAHYLVSLLDVTRDHFLRIDRNLIPTNLPAATMTIEDFARYVERTGDWPRK